MSGPTPEALPLLRLLQVSDSAFPSGAFAFSHGLETLHGEGHLSHERALEAFLVHQVVPRWMEMDRWYLGQAWFAAGAEDAARLRAFNDQCHAQLAVADLVAASQRLGQAALLVHRRLGTPRIGLLDPPAGSGPIAPHLIIVQGVIARGLGLSLSQAETMGLYTLLSGLMGAAIRLGAVGALSAQTLLTGTLATASQSLTQPADDPPHAFSPLADIAAMRRHAGGTRLFAT